MYAVKGKCANRTQGLEADQVPGVRCTVLGAATGRGSQGAGRKRTVHHVCVKEGSERKMRVKIKPVNDMAVSDEHINIIILKKPKRRYRQIVKAYYRGMQKKGVKES